MICKLHKSGFVAALLIFRGLAFGRPRTWEMYTSRTIAKPSRCPGEVQDWKWDGKSTDRRQGRQESCAIAKMTAPCALY